MMGQKVLFPAYIPRGQEEAQIKGLAEQVHRGRQSRAALLYGEGGVGKTFLVRHLAQTAPTGSLIWLEPVDVDDSEYWLMPNLQRRVAESLAQKSPSGAKYFEEYLKYASQIPRYERSRLGYETVLAHLRRGEEVFYRGYVEFINSTGQTPVITLDTVETIRGTDMLLSLTQWMKQLPGTLFVLAGRPVAVPGHADPLAEELGGPYQPLPYDPIELSGFTWAETLNYLGSNGVAAALSEEEKEKLALLSRGRPLWLALAVDYLAWEGMPQEARENSLGNLRQWLAYEQPMSPEGKRLHEAFVRRLVVPFRETDFWHEAIKRLAVVRQRVSPNIWQELMADRPLPEGVSTWDEAWQRLLQFPWVRPRANRRYITLHDALAEELARRIIPLHDKEGAWRRQQWHTATVIYRDLSASLGQELAGQQTALNGALRPRLSKKRQRELVQQVAGLDARKRELEQLKSAWFYYQMLSDFEAGCRLFIDLFDAASREHQFRLRELLWLEMQCFLPGETAENPLEDVIRPVVDRFRNWLAEHPNLEYEIGWRGARHLIDIGRPQDAAVRLNRLLEASAGDLEKEYRLYILRGNARMHIPGQVKDAEQDLRTALARATHPDAPDTLKNRRGEAHKELGFYFRQTGRWDEASKAYLEALRVTPLTDVVERASIQSNWAYVQALQGGYHEALNLVETALNVRRRRNLRRGMGMALSVKGEIYRYWHDFSRAWEAYREAELIFEELADWPWLGLIRQEQAICLFQARQAQMALSGFKNLDDMYRQARLLAVQALDICRDLSIRAYPSALNRAGRIFGHADPDEGLKYLSDGIKSAREVADGWFLFANMVEYVELLYRAWTKTEAAAYLKKITSLAREVEQVRADYDFSDLSGRWELIQGHLKIHNALASGNQALLKEAEEHYKKGFPLIARGFVGSHGMPALAGEWQRFRGLFAQLPQQTRREWCEAFQQAWSDPALHYIDSLKQSTALLGWLTELSAEFMP